MHGANYVLFSKGEEFLYHAIEVKNIWLPMGDIFANQHFR